MSWKALVEKNVLGRQYSSLLQRWESSWGEESHNEPVLEDYLSEIIPMGSLDLSNASQLINAPGSIQSAISEIIRLKAKADCAWSGTVCLIESGRISWSSIDAHHASLMYARYLCGFFGVFFVSLYGNWHVIDVFPDFRGPSKKKQNQFNEEAKDISSPIRVLSYTSHGGQSTIKIDQRHFWDTLKRAMRVLRSEGQFEGEIRWIGKFDSSKFHPVRNKIFYNGTFWTDLGDLTEPMPDGYRSIEAYTKEDLTDISWMEDCVRDHILLCTIKKISEKFSPANLKESELAKLKLER